MNNYGNFASDDISDVCLVQGNKRFKDKAREEVASKLWTKAVAYGVGYSKDNIDFIGAIKEMKFRDEEASNQKEVQIKGFS